MTGAEQPAAEPAAGVNAEAVRSSAPAAEASAAAVGASAAAVAGASAAAPAPVAAVVDTSDSAVAAFCADVDSSLRERLLRLPQLRRVQVMAGENRGWHGGKAAVLEKRLAGAETDLRPMLLPTGVERSSALERRRPPFGLYTERYYSSVPIAHQGPEGGGQYAALHTNNLVVVGIAEDHPALSSGSPARVDWHQRCTDLQCTGKKKKGAVICQPSTVLCELVGARGEKWRVHAGVHGSLIEINERLAGEPELLARPREDGWIAIISPFKQFRESSLESRLDEEQLKKRRKEADAPDAED
eukprot:Hpha_TRINITY_DN32162_c0_g1::TRINITY_DN32162_c0_g1_i1::g.18484::m.18484